MMCSMIYVLAMCRNRANTPVWDGMISRVVNACKHADRNKLVGISEIPYTMKKSSRLHNDSYCRPSIFKIRNSKDVKTTSMVETINIQINRDLVPLIVIVSLRF